MPFVDFRPDEGGMLVMEYQPLGSLRDSGEKKKICKAEAIQCFVQGLDALEYLQQLKITHRDIKPENILVSYRANDGTNIRTKLADFGLAKLGSDLASEKGTLAYMAPEIRDGEILRKKYPPYIADTWSLAMVFIEYFQEIDMVKNYQKFLYHGRSHALWCERIHKVGQLMTDHWPKDTLLKMANKMLAVKKEMRPNARDVLEIFKECLDLREALHRVRTAPSPNKTPLCWENDPEPQEGLSSQEQQQLQVVAGGSAKQDNATVRLEESLPSWTSSMFEMVSAIRQGHEDQPYVLPPWRSSMFGMVSAARQSPQDQLPELSSWRSSFFEMVSANP